MAGNEEITNAKRKLGSALAAMEDWLAKREAAIRELKRCTEGANEEYRKAIAAERVCVPRDKRNIVAPARRADVTVVLPMLDEHAPRDPSIYAPLVETVKRETAEREARQQHEDALKRGPVNLPAGLPVSGL